jgi:hypothetical protein
MPGRWGWMILTFRLRERERGRKGGREWVVYARMEGKK